MMDIIDEVNQKRVEGKSIGWVKVHRLLDRALELRALRNALESGLAKADERGDAAESALVSMVRQYLQLSPAKDGQPATYSHDFMSAGEEALEYLENRKVVECQPFEKYVFVADKKGL